MGRRLLGRRWSPMRAFPAVLLVALCLTLPNAVAVPDLGLPGLDTAERDYIVGFHDVVPADAQEGGTFHGGKVVRVDDALAFAVVRTADAVVFEGAIKTDDRVKYVEWDDPHFARVSFVPNDARYNDAGHYGSKIIGAEAAWDRTLGTTAVKVAVIDTGLRKTHEEFAGSGRVLQGWDFVNNDDEPNDDCGHGTHVAGTIGATIDNGKGIAGLAQATILPIKGLSNTLFITCTGSASALASALAYAADQGAHLSSNSWGGGSSSAMLSAIDYSYSKGTAVVAAAGNDGPCSNCVSQPWKSRASKVTIVGSTTSSDGQSGFSSDGPELDLVAPGSSILSSYNSNDASYSTLSGTSMATPHVAGAMALVKTLNPSFGPDELDQRLKDTAKDLGASGYDQIYGWGRIDVDAATAGGTPPPPPPPTNDPPTAAFTWSCTDLACTFDGTASSDPDGTIASYAWTFGDGATGAGSSPGHTYAAAGTYAVALTVTDDDGAADATSASVTVTAGGDPDPSTPTLQNGAARSDSIQGAGSERFYKIQVPAGSGQLQVVLDGPACGLLSCNPDLDLYVRKGSKPTDGAYDCRPYQSSSDETCTIGSPGADWWYIRVKVYSGSSAGSYQIRATHS